MSTQQSTCFCCWDDLSYGLNTLGPLCLWQCLQNSRSSISCFRIPLFLVIRFIFQFTSKLPSILLWPSASLTSRHVLEDCFAVEAWRIREGARTFLTECRMVDWSRATAYRFFISVYKKDGTNVLRKEHRLRGGSLIRLRNAWLATWKWLWHWNQIIMTKAVNSR